MNMYYVVAMNDNQLSLCEKRYKSDVQKMVHELQSW